MDKIVIAILGENLTQVKMRVMFKDLNFLFMERTFKSVQTGELGSSTRIFAITY